MKDRTVLLFSGGIDSTITLFILLNQGKEITLITFSFPGQPPMEIESAKSLANQTLVEHIIIDLPYTNHVSNIYPNYSTSNNSSDTKFLPGRNILFLSIASIYAYERQIKTIHTGIVDLKGQVYPDCSEKFLIRMEKSLNIGLGYPIKIISPQLKFNVKDQYSIAKQLNIIDTLKNKTHSCFYNIEKGCKNCPKCRDRKAFFKYE